MANGSAVVEELEAIATAWIAEHKDYRERRGTTIGWGYQELNRLCRDDAGRALAVIEMICAKNASDPIMEVLAAGPLENLLAAHGSSIIDRIEQLARTSETFRDLLGGVWKSTIDGEVWRRIEAARSGTW